MIATTVEQSKKLVELGIDPSTADMWWAERYVGYTDSIGRYTIQEKPYYYLDFEKPSETNVSQDVIKDIPAWSLTALLGLMPTFTLNGFSNGQFNCRDERANNYALVDTCPLDAAFEMIVWLKENGKI